jgi:hypothetical protein
MIFLMVKCGVLYEVRTKLLKVYSHSIPELRRIVLGLYRYWFILLKEDIICSLQF